MAITPEQRTSLQAIRLRLLDLHKLLLDREREIYEKANGMLGSPGEYLSLVLNNAAFAWLRTLSGIIVELDELVSPRTKLSGEEARAALQSIRELLVLAEDGDDYRKRYWQAVQESPDILIAHCKAESLLRAQSRGAS